MTAGDIPFFQRMPHSMELGQRMVFEALGYASDSIELSVSCLNAIAAEAQDRDQKEFRFSSQERIIMFTEAWNIVDRVSAFGQLLYMSRNWIRDLKIPQHEQVRELRNAMDHLPGLLKTLKDSKKNGRPLFGFLTYVWFMDEDIEDNNKAGAVRSFHVVMTTASTAYKEMSGNPNDDIDIPKEMKSKVDNFTLHHFKRSTAPCRVNLSQAARDVVSIRKTIEAEVEKALVEVVTREPNFEKRLAGPKSSLTVIFRRTAA